MDMRTTGRTPIQRMLLAVRALALPLLAVTMAGTAIAAEDFWDALTGGAPTLDLRGRVEIAELQTLSRSESYTIRTRLGYGTKAWYGASIYADFENIAAIAPGNHWNLVDAPNGKTPVADPTTTEVNQAYLKYTNEDLLGTTVIGGRQRIKFDDDRFIGNVGWRQNEQTYDAALLDSSLGVDKLSIKYGFIGMVRRIFGDQGSQPDWNSRSHIINASYAGLDAAKVIAFAYLLDFKNSSAANSTMTYGLRAEGKLDFTNETSLGYQTSWAYQQDWKSNPKDYKAHYFLGDVNIGHKPCGKLGVGFEMLGSDDGNAQFRTPLHTGHKFSGWADLFAAGPAVNGGPNGLRDIYAYVAPKLPWKLKGKLVYHHFRNDASNAVLGNEIDVLLKRPIGNHLDVLAKSAYFANRANLPDTYRVWLQATVKF